MRFVVLPGFMTLAIVANAQAPAGNLWNELKAKREQLQSFHQEFEVAQTYRTSTTTQSSKRQVILDMSHNLWREKSSSGSGSTIRMFDGKDIVLMEEGGGEYVRTKRSSKDDPSVPPSYTFDLDLSKLKEMERRPCGLPGKDHECVVLQAPIKRSTRANGPNRLTTVFDGTGRFVFDTETGLLILSQTAQGIDNGKTSYESDTNRLLKRMAFGTPADEGLFKLASADLREVKELSRWDAAKMKKELVGKPAPELEVVDLHGQPISLAALKGKTVLLDFWTTWCPPCRADAPSIEKLNKKYGNRELAIVGISVSEERELVEKFLKEHPHSYSIVLTTENEMPRPYEVGVFPTYIVIDKDGTFAAAVEGDRGFSELRKLLTKAGMDTD
jgi:thiol-disulfide isomerase/thioredoxin